VRDGPSFVHALTTAPLSPQVNVIGPECVMDPVSFMEREVKQLIDTGVA
jgi:adenylosuccinate synthase